MSDSTAQARRSFSVLRGRPAPIDLSDLPVTVREHFKLCWFTAVLRVVQVAHEVLGVEAVGRDFRFLAEYEEELERRGLSFLHLDAVERFQGAVEAWEEGAAVHLPLRALRHTAEQGWGAVGALVTAGLVEDDPRFAALFSRLEAGRVSTPTVGFLNTYFSHGERAPVRDLQELGLLDVHATGETRFGWTVQVPAWLWDHVTGAATHGERAVSGPGFELEVREAFELPEPDVALSDEARKSLAALPDLVRSGVVDAVVVKGPRASGRSTVARRLAARLGRGVLIFAPAPAPNDPRWTTIGPLATVLGAVPVVEITSGPGESAVVPAIGRTTAPLVVLTGRRGSVSGAAAARPLVVELRAPPVAARRAVWESLVPALEPALLDAVASSYRMPIGRLVQLGRQAVVRAVAGGRGTPTLADFRACARSLHSEELGTLAAALPEHGDLEGVALPDDVTAELRAVESRCRHRERVAALTSFGTNAGVRVLFAGPSGTGKTLAAAQLSRALGKDAYRVDLAAVVNKYIGETEKNLDRLLSLAEELDVVLLLDEGDALLTRRTAVQSSTDRYANLETNFLLQRLESFEGILFVTSNAAERIDGAFQRRMDAIIEFRMPEVSERRRLWELHLPAESSVGAELLERIAAQCSLSGGQIRNAALHAQLLSFDAGGEVTGPLLVQSVRREYRKLGTVCPLHFP